jgi:hypothetical protein
MMEGAADMGIKNKASRKSGFPRPMNPKIQVLKEVGKQCKMHAVQSKQTIE